MSGERLVDAKSAAAMLGIRRATLYAYVSRGIIRSAEGQSDPRCRLYNIEDIQRLKQQKLTRRSPEKAAAAALDWGLPVLDSSLTQMTDSRFFYRNHDVLDLAESASLEDVAGILWKCGGENPFQHKDMGFFLQSIEGGVSLREDLIGKCRATLQLLRSGQISTWQSSSRMLFADSADIAKAILLSVTDGKEDSSSLHIQMANNLNAPPESSDLIRRALVLIADHELNASAFAVRVASSTGASLTASITAGLCAFSGPLHGGQLARVESLFDELEQTNDAEKVVMSRVYRGEAVPGFGHHLYRGSDPRAMALLDRLPAHEDAFALQAAVSSILERNPNVSFALVALCRSLNLPRGAAMAIFIVGRTVGWLAHALEQISTGRVIRPRARYIDELPPRTGEDL